MDNLDKTVEIIPVNILSGILFDDNTYEDFINRRGNFKEDIEKYIEPLNDFMDIYRVKAIGLSEEIFNRINRINIKFGGNRRFEYMDYLLKTEPMVSIYDIKQILNDEETFENFLNFNQFRNWFPLDLIDYLAALDDYVAYFKKTAISLSKEEISRFNRIKLEYVLEYKRLVTLKGEDVSVNLAPELEEEILLSIDLSKDKFTVARELYIELNKRCTYNVQFMSYDQNLEVNKAKEIYDGKVSYKKKKYRVVCSSWSMIYAHLLNRCGINAKVTRNKGIHTFVEFDCDGTLMRADATSEFLGEEGLYMSDLTRCQLGLKTVGFVCMEPDKDISYVLDRADEEISYKHHTKTSLIKNYADEYRRKYLSRKTSVTDKIKFLMRIAKNSPLDNLELFKYINLLYENVFDQSELSNVSKKYVSINRKYAGLVVSYLNDDGVFEFVVFGKRYNKKYNGKQLNRLINKGKIVSLGHNKDIYGLERVDNKDENRRAKR